MDSGGATDPELEELRARRLRELMARSREARSPPAPAPRPTELRSPSFGAFLAANPRCVIDVWAPWCGPCRAMAPVLDALARELAPAVAFGKLNADDEPELVGRFGVTGIPTLLAFDRTRLVDRIVGALPRDELRARLTSAFGIGPGPTGASPE